MYTYNGMLLSHEKEYFDTCFNTDGHENIMLTEINQKQKGKYYTIPPIWGTRTSTFRETESKIEVTLCWGEGPGRGRCRELVFNGCRVSLGDDENVLGTEKGKGYTSLMCSMPMNCKFKELKIYTVYILPQFKKKIPDPWNTWARIRVVCLSH